MAGRAAWTTAYINDLPDSAFAHIELGGEKDEDGKTTPRSKRHFPHHDAAGKIDLPHLRNALSRAPQSPFGPKAMVHLRRHAKAEGVGESDYDSPAVEHRTFPLEVRLSDDDAAGPKIGGTAAVFNSLSLDLGGFREQIAPGAFHSSLHYSRSRPIKSFFNHDPSMVLGRTDNKTLTLEETEHGLAFEVTPPETSWAADLLTSMKRGDVRDASFAFRTKKDEWELSADGKTQVRTLLDVELFEVGPVTSGAYPAADSQVRAMLEARGLPVAEDGSVPVPSERDDLLDDGIDLEGLIPAYERLKDGAAEDGDELIVRSAISALTLVMPQTALGTTISGSLVTSGTNGFVHISPNTAVPWTITVSDGTVAEPRSKPEPEIVQPESDLWELEVLRYRLELARRRVS